MKKDWEIYRDTGIIGGYIPEQAKLRRTEDGEVATVFRDTVTHEEEDCMESLCRTKEIRLQMNTVSLPQMLKFDRVLIERAIMNVISNGLDYSPQGGTLYVDVQSNNGFVEISVTDEGTGFSKEALCHAQERFYMGDQSRNSKLHFGMGLYITNSIMEQHNGQLILENSKETGGAKVTMKLPC